MGRANRRRKKINTAVAVAMVLAVEGRKVAGKVSYLPCSAQWVLGRKRRKEGRIV